MAAIDTKETKNSLFGNLRKETEKEMPSIKISSEEVRAAKPVEKILDQTMPKWQSLDKVTALLTTEQKEGLDRIARKLMKHRSKILKRKDDCERITTNTLLRALIEVFLKEENSLELDVLLSESDVCEWVSKSLIKKQS